MARSPRIRGIPVEGVESSEQLIEVMNSYMQDAGDTFDALIRESGEEGPKPVWIAPRLENGWVNYNENTNPIGYRREGYRVYLRGSAKSGTVLTTIFTLPVGYRPAHIETIVTVANDAIARCDITREGSVKASLGSNAWFQLDGLSFDVA